MNWCLMIMFLSCMFSRMVRPTPNELIFEDKVDALLKRRGWICCSSWTVQIYYHYHVSCGPHGEPIWSRGCCQLGLLLAQWWAFRCRRGKKLPATSAVGMLGLFWVLFVMCIVRFGCCLGHVCNVCLWGLFSLGGFFWVLFLCFVHNIYIYKEMFLWEISHFKWEIRWGPSHPYLMPTT